MKRFVYLNMERRLESNEIPSSLLSSSSSKSLPNGFRLVLEALGGFGGPWSGVPREFCISVSAAVIETAGSFF